MQDAQRTHYNVLKITAPGRETWNKGYIDFINTHFSSAAIAAHHYGDGESPIDLTGLHNAFASYNFNSTHNFIFITAHGSRNTDSKFFLEFAPNDLVKTQAVFQALNNHTNRPLYILLASCYSGACEQDVMGLPEGSIVFTTSSANTTAYGVDGKYIATALAKLGRMNIRPDLAMYFLVYTYLTDHVEFRGNSPALIIRGHGEVIQKPFSDFAKLSLKSNIFSRAMAIEEAKIHWQHLPMNEITSFLSEDKHIPTPGMVIDPALQWKRFTLSSALAVSQYSTITKVIRHRLACKDKEYWLPKMPPLPLVDSGLFTVIGNQALQSGVQSEIILNPSLRAAIMTSLQNSALLSLLYSDEHEAARIVDKFNIKNRILLKCVLKKKQFHLALSLIQQGTDFREMIIEDLPVLKFAINERQDSVVAALLYKNCRYADVKINDLPLIFYAVQHPEILKALIFRDKSIVDRVAGIDQITVLSYANSECTKILLDAGADPNKLDHQGYTSLHRAIISHDIDKFRILYRHPKTDKGVETPSSETYLQFAKARNALDVVNYLEQLLKPKVTTPVVSEKRKTYKKTYAEVVESERSQQPRKKMALQLISTSK